MVQRTFLRKLVNDVISLLEKKKMARDPHSSGYAAGMSGHKRQKKNALRVPAHNAVKVSHSTEKVGLVGTRNHLKCALTVSVSKDKKNC